MLRRVEKENYPLPEVIQMPHEIDCNWQNVKREEKKSQLQANGLAEQVRPPRIKSNCAREVQVYV